MSLFESSMEQFFKSQSQRVAMAQGESALDSTRWSAARVKSPLAYIRHRNERVKALSRRNQLIREAYERGEDPPEVQDWSSYNPMDDPLFAIASPEAQPHMARARTPMELREIYTRAATEELARGIDEGGWNRFVTDPTILIEVGVGVLLPATTVARIASTAWRVAAMSGIEAATAAAVASGSEALKGASQLTYGGEEWARRATQEGLLAGVSAGVLFGVGYGARSGLASVKARIGVNPQVAQNVSNHVQQVMANKLGNVAKPTHKQLASAFIEGLKDAEQNGLIPPSFLRKGQMKQAAWDEISRGILAAANETPLFIPGMKQLFDTPEWRLTRSQFSAARTAAQIYSGSPIARRMTPEGLIRPAIETEAEYAAGRLMLQVGEVRRTVDEAIGIPRRKRLIPNGAGDKLYKAKKHRLNRALYHILNYGDELDPQNPLVHDLVKGMSPSEIAAVNKAAKHSRLVLQEIHQRGASIGLWPHRTFDGADGKTALTYITRIWDEDLVRSRKEDAYDMLVAWSDDNKLGWGEEQIQDTLRNLQGIKRARAQTPEAVSARSPRRLEIPQDFKFTTRNGASMRAIDLQVQDVEHILSHHANRLMRDIVTGEAMQTAGAKRLTKRQRTYRNKLRKFTEDAGSIDGYADRRLEEMSHLDSEVLELDKEYIQAHINYVEHTLEVAGRADSGQIEELRKIRPDLVIARKKQYEIRQNRAIAKDTIKANKGFRAQLKTLREERAALAADADPKKIADLDLDIANAEMRVAELDEAEKFLKDHKGELTKWNKREKALRNRVDSIYEGSRRTARHGSANSMAGPLNPAHAWRKKAAVLNDYDSIISKLTDRADQIGAMSATSADDAIDGIPVEVALLKNRDEALRGLDPDDLADQKKIAAINKEYDQDLQMIQAANQKTRMIIQRSVHPGVELGATRLRQLASTSTLGWVPITSLGDLVNNVVAQGLAPAAKGISRGLLRTAKLVKERFKGRDARNALEKFLHATEVESTVNRTTRHFGLEQGPGIYRRSETKTGRAIDKISAGFLRWGGMSQANRMMKRISMNIAADDVLTIARKLEAGGKMAEDEIERMTAMGLSESVLRRIGKEADNFEDWAENFATANTSAWRSQDVREIFERALLQHANNVVVTPGALSSPAFLDHPVMGTMFMFFRFFTSHFSKVIRPAYMNDHSHSTAFLLSSLMMGAVQQELRDFVRGRDRNREREIARHKRTSPGGYMTSKMLDWMERGGAMTTLFTLNGYTSAIPGFTGIVPEGIEAVTGDDFKLLDEAAGRWKARGGANLMLGPAFSYGNRVVGVAGALMNAPRDGLTVGQLDQFRHTLPWGNHVAFEVMNNLIPRLTGVGGVSGYNRMGVRQESDADMFKQLGRSLGAKERRDQ